MSMVKRLADLDDRLFARWPMLVARTSRSRIQVLLIHQVFAMAALLAAVVLQSYGVAIFALGFVMLTILGLARMLTSQDMGE